MSGLEQQIAEQREKAEKAMREGNPDKAVGHPQVAFGLVSKLTDKQAEDSDE